MLRAILGILIVTANTCCALELGETMTWLFQLVPGVTNTQNKKPNVTPQSPTMQTGQIKINPDGTIAQPIPGQGMGRNDKVDWDRSFFPKTVINDEAAPEWNMTFHEICQANGFQSEEHQVTTEDGYILTVHRIYKGSPEIERKVVFLQHGTMDCSTVWIIHEPQLAPAFQLANEGYDVWLGNTRGNTYSRGHTTLDNRSMDYWDFSLPEFGKYDVPATVELVRNKTGQKKMTYIGHSWGASQMFYALTKYANTTYYKDRINLFIALAPSHQLNNMQVPFLKLIAQLTHVFKWPFIKMFSPWQGIFVKGTSVSHYDNGTNRPFWFRKWVPQYKMLADWMDEKFNPFYNWARVRAFKKGHFPNGISFKSIVHMGNMVLTGKFVEKDYGPRGNLQRYGQREPPVIDISKIEDIPIAMFSGSRDVLSTQKDCRFIRDQLKSLIYYKEIRGSHLSFQMGKDMSFMDDVFKLMKENQ